MFNVFFYKDKNGKRPVLEYIRGLTKKGDKDNRIKANKILEYIDYLRKEGPKAREPHAKHLDGDIWELRPISDRILYAAWNGNSFILLHHFTKKTKKILPLELKQAKRNLSDYRERSNDGE
jgi:phage-related protein